MLRLRPVQTERWIPPRGTWLLPRGTWLLPRGTWRNRRHLRSPHISAQRPRSVHFFCPTAIAVPSAGVPGWPWLPRPTSLAKTLAEEAAHRQRRLNFQQPAALTSRSKRGEREGSREGLLGRKRSCTLCVTFLPPPCIQALLEDW